MKKNRKSKSGPGSVLLIACLLIGSAGLRVVSSASSVLAADEAEPETMEYKADAATETQPKKEMDTGTLLAALLRRESEVSEREEKIEKRMVELQAAKEELRDRLNALEAAELRLKKTIALAETAAEDDLNRLTAVYENMKPKDAAALFEEMDPDFAAGFMARMRPDAAADLMSGLSPQVAYSVSAILAGRNANVPTR